MLHALLHMSLLLLCCLALQQFEHVIVISEIIQDRYDGSVKYASRTNFTQQTNKNWQTHNGEGGNQELDYVIQSSIVKLRLSIRNPSVLRNVPSCQYTISQIELLSLDSRDKILVKAITTELEEETTVIEEMHVEAAFGQNQNDDRKDSYFKRETIHKIPYRQFHPSKLPRNNSVLELGPGQVVIIPLTFIPRFPDIDVTDDYRFLDDDIREDFLDSEANDTRRHNSSASYYYTPFQKADWDDWGNSLPNFSLFSQFSPSIQNNKQRKYSNHQHRRNWEGEPRKKENHRHAVYYKVRTTLYIETDRGVVEMPLEATSRRENQFSLPDVIAFSFDDECNSTFGVCVSGYTESTVAPASDAVSSAPSISTSLETSEEEQERIIAETLRLFRKRVNHSDKEQRKSKKSEIQSERTRKEFFTNTKVSSANAILIVDSMSTANIAFEKFRYQKKGSDQEPGFSSLSGYSPCDCYDLFVKHPASESSSHHNTAATSSSRNSIYTVDSELPLGVNHNTRKRMANNLHLSSSASFYVLEVHVSHPELVSLQISPPNKLQLLDSQQALYREVTPRQMINEWVRISPKDIHEDIYMASSNSTGMNDSNEFIPGKSLVVPADGKQHYVVTICSNAKMNSNVQFNGNATANIREVQEFLGASFTSMPSTSQGRSNWNNVTKTKSLGFLQIRTNLDTLFVALEQKHNNSSLESSRFTLFDNSIIKKSTEGSKERGLVADSLGQRSSAPSSSTFVKESGSTQLLRAEPEHLRFNFLQTGNALLTYDVDLEAVTNDYSVYVRRVSIALQPPKIPEDDFSTVGKQRHKRKFTIEITEAHEAVKTTPFDKMGISLKIEAINASLGNLFTGTAENYNRITSAIKISCAVDWEKMRSLKYKLAQLTSPVLNLEGAVVIRGNTIRATETKIIDTLLQSQLVESVADIRKQTNFVFEIPLTITIHKDAMLEFVIQETTHPYSLFWLFSRDRYVGGSAALRGAFFPLTPEVFMHGLTSREKVQFTQAAGFDAIHSSNSHGGVAHRLRLQSSEHSQTVVSIETINIIHAGPSSYARDRKLQSGLDETHRKLENSNCNICNRFSASYSMSANTNSKRNNSLTVATIDLNYSFGSQSEYLTFDDDFTKKGKKCGLNTDLEHSFICNLQIKTLPDTGIHTLPLLIFSGQLEVSSRSYLSQFFPTNNKGGAESRLDHIVGFENVLDWFVTSNLGSRLRALLAGNSNSRNPQNRPEATLTRYLYSLLPDERQGEERQWSKNKIPGLNKDSFKSERALHPIVLKAASIADDDVEVVPLTLTNHNPLPITITIEVAQVEGMAIGIGRDQTLQNTKSPDNLLHSNFQSEKKGFISNNRSDKNPFRSALDYISRMSLRDTSIFEAKEFMGPRVKGGTFDGHPLHALRDFLLTDDIAVSFLRRFPYHDAISLRESAAGEQSLLGQMYRSHAQARLHKIPTAIDRVPRSPFGCLWEQVGHPPLYGSINEEDRFSAPSHAKRPVLGPILSDDNDRYHHLKICSHKPDIKSLDRIVIPPGGVVRFDIWVRAPGLSFSDKDISNFLATGLVLSTNLGETMPLLVCFEALQGMLEVSHIPTLRLQQPDTQNHFKEMNGGTRIPVPTVLFGRVGDRPKIQNSVKISPRGERTAKFSDLIQGQMIFTRNASIEENGVSLYMKSSFTKDIDLHEVISCNPWFQVTLMNQSSPGAQTNALVLDPFLGSQIGTINSIVPCDTVNGISFNFTTFPSFYRCVLNWLSHGSDLQSNGCGRAVRRSSEIPNQSDELMSSPFDLKQLTRVFHRALLISEWNDELYSISAGMKLKGGEAKRCAGLKHPIKSGRRGEDGLVAPLLLEVIADAFQAYDQASEKDKLVIGTSLRAVMEYRNHDCSADSGSSSILGAKEEDQGRILSAMIKNVTFESHLLIPRLANFATRWTQCASRSDSRLHSSSTMCFEPTLIGNVASGYIPLRNPTPVAIRVRLGVAPLGTNNPLSGFLGSFQIPYVQSRRKVILSPRDYAHHQWWESGGSFFHHDSSGNLIRSHYNITMRAGSGARVSLVNPSFLANSAFLVGCGGRCGLRNEMQPNLEILVNLAPTSPIGASAAMGKFLVGRQRSSAGLVNIYMAADALFAGGSLISGGIGPSAFAIPFSALDEIIVPPFGEVELGPILFRPPGRTSIVGCEASAGSVQYDHCESQEFEGNVFLENSLTGLERITLRGKALMEKVVFVDPTDMEFGNIELRYGHSALVFPGTAAATSDAVIRHVLVQNDGDTQVTVTRGYFLPVSDFRQVAGQFEEADRTCELNRFELLGCQREESLFPFELSPGQNQSLWIKHRPHCSKKKDYVVLVVELDRKDKRPLQVDYHSGERVHLQQIHVNANPFLTKKIELLVGYEMESIQFASCIPSFSSTQTVGKSELHVHFNASETDHPQLVKRGVLFFCLTVEGFVSVLSIVVTTMWIRVVASMLLVRHGQSWSLRSRFVECRARSCPEKNERAVVPSAMWGRSSRCMENPSLVDLRNFARDRTRRLILSRYKALCVSPPQCFTSSGLPLRERSGFASSIGGRHGTSSWKSGKVASGNGGTERNRTLSDSLFGRYSSHQLFEDGMLPARLGWRTAASAGIINSSTMWDLPFRSKVKALKLDRLNNPVSVDSDHSLGDSDADGNSKSFHDSDLDSSYDHSLRDETEKHGMDFVNIVATTSDGLNNGEHSGLHSPLLRGTDSKDSCELLDFELAKPKEQYTYNLTSHSLESAKAQTSRLAQVAESETNIDLRLPLESDTNITEVQIHKHKLANGIPQTSDIKPTIRSAFEVVVHKNVSSDSGDPTENQHAVKSFQQMENQSKDGLHRNEKGNASKNISSEKETQLLQSQNSKKSSLSPTKPSRLKNKVATEESRRNVKEKSQEDMKFEKKQNQGKERSARRKVNTSKIVLQKDSLPLEKDSVQPAQATPESQYFKPPPGLAPPPGFGDVSVCLPYAQSSSATNDMILPFPSSQQPDKSVELRYESTIRDLSHTDLGMLVPQDIGTHFVTSHLSVPNTHEKNSPLASSNAISPLDLLYPWGLGASDSANSLFPENNSSTAEFDVMDFLDGILNDGGSLSAEDEAVEILPANLMMESAVLASTSSPARLRNGSLLPFVSNPWATEEQLDRSQSRLSTYGIAIEDPSDRIPGVTQTALALPTLEESSIFLQPTQRKNDDPFEES